MNILVAGASGAIGVPLVRALLAHGYTVTGLTRTPEKRQLLSDLGAESLLADALKREELLQAVKGRHFDAVIHMLTALPRGGPMRHSDMDATNTIRNLGTGNLLAAARSVEARRFLAESMILGYGYGDWGEQILSEEQPFGPPGSTKALERHVAGLRTLEEQVFAATKAGWLEGIALRYGAFYGRELAGQMVGLLRHKLPFLPNGGHSVLSWIALEDAASAMIAALERGRAGQAYNIVDDEPVRLLDFFTCMAHIFAAPEPRTLPGWLLRLAAPYGYIFLGGTTMRVSNAKAKQELAWAPALPTYREGLKWAAQGWDE
ncbi:NAD(P)-dependent oxidoreductase [Ktedonosporobacter rubrisoli]|uniref:NAD(P)-dependent oxidoreductase n=1 Tax=Ktedonosporobacter rubrisoli TaxID=2509675 RepID=A0A4P6JJD0_KTERU|nr:NAD(P)-dependent oxidoreductase [Ktedonosporobacter rubrisoli]QBD75215.1 NAD(P)-dependent oxidoreductase [Ktedonosporobacter rubrisoli]